MTAPAKLIDILLVEDSASDVELTRCVFEDAKLGNRLHVVGDGKQALDFVHRRGAYAEAPRPDMLLLDLNLPELGGAELARLMREDPESRDIPIVILTGSQMDKDGAMTLGERANFYLTKPLTFYALINAIQSFEDFWVGLVTYEPRIHAIKKHLPE